MDESKEKNSDKKNKLEWFKDKHNLIFLAILIAAIAIRLYFLFLTQNQPLWWDEAEYGLKAKNIAFGTPETGWAPERELIIPFILSFLLKIGLGEFSWRIFEFLISVLTVAMSYFVISNLTNKKIGLVSAFGMAFFWLHIFFSQRILIYPIVPLLYLIIIHLFYEGYLKENANRKMFLAFPIFSALALMTYFSVGFLLFGLFIYLLVLEKSSLFKNKKAWKVLGIFIIALLPFAIYFQFTYGFPIPRLAIGYQATTSEFGAGISGLTEYVKMLPSRVGWSFTFLGVVGIVYLLSLLSLGWGIEGTIKNNKNWILIFTSFFVPFAMYTLYGTIGGSATFYDAFILGVFPFFFALSGLGLEKIYEFISKHHRPLATVIIIIFLSIHAYQGIRDSNSSILSRIDSYDSVKAGGLWIKQNSLPEDKIVSASLPQNTYYSERVTFSMQKNESALFELIEKERPRYFVDSIWEPVPEWVHEVPHKYPERFKPVHGSGPALNQPTLIVYEIQY